MSRSRIFRPSSGTRGGDDPLLHVPLGRQRVPNARVPDLVWHDCRDIRRVRLGSFLRVCRALGIPDDLAERRRVALIPEAEWQRLTDMCVKLRDEMDSSGKYLKSELMQVQCALAIIADPTTRAETRQQSVDRVVKLFERENPPPDADTNEAKVEDEALKDAPTLDLMKRILGGSA